MRVCSIHLILPLVVLGWLLLVGFSLAQLGDPAPSIDPHAFALMRIRLLAGQGIGFLLLSYGSVGAVVHWRRAPWRARSGLALAVAPLLIVAAVLLAGG